jgi:Flp pilus assembly pilin Flp
MRDLVHELVQEFVRDESGQSITEYGAIIAFVGVMIAMAFGLVRGSLFNSVSGSYSSVVNSLNTLNSYSSSSSS